MDHLCFLRLVFLMLSRLFIAAFWSPAGTAGLLALVGYVYCIFCYFPMLYPGSGVVLDCIHGIVS